MLAIYRCFETTGSAKIVPVDTLDSTTPMTPTSGDHLPVALPVIANANAENAEAEANRPTLKDRCCTFVSLVPALIVLVVCIIGLSIVLIYHNPYLAIPFGLGTALSFYLLYISYTHRFLKAMEELYHQYKAERIRLGGEVNRLKGEVGELKGVRTELSEQNQKFSAENGRLAVENGLYHANNDRLTLTADALRGQVGDSIREREQWAIERAALTTENASLKDTAKGLAALKAGLEHQLDGLLRQYTEIVAKAQADSTQRDSADVKQKIALIELLKEQIAVLKKSNADKADKDASHVTQLATTIRDLTFAVTASQKIMSSLDETARTTFADIMKKHLHEFALLQKTNADMHHQVGEATGTLKATVQSSHAANEQLKALNEQLSKKIEEFADHLKGHEGLKREFATIAKQMTDGIASAQRKLT